MADLIKRFPDQVYSAYQMYSTISDLTSEENTVKAAQVIVTALYINALWNLYHFRKTQTTTNLAAALILDKAKTGFEHRKFDEQLATQEAHIQKLQKLNNTYHDQNATYQSENQKLQEERFAYQSENQNLKSNVQQLEQLIGDFEKFTKEVSFLSLQRENLDKIVGDYQDQLQETQRVWEDVTKQLNESIDFQKTELWESAITISNLSKELIRQLKLPNVNETLIKSTLEVITNIHNQLTENQRKLTIKQSK